MPKTEVYKDLDLSYKYNALRVTYDIESMPNLFTLAMIHDNALSLMFFGDEQFDDLTDDELIKQMHDFGSKKTTLEDLNVNSYKDLDYHLYRYQQGNKEDMKRFRKDLLRIISCQRLESDKKYDQYNTQLTEYAGWNSAHYDLPLIILTYLAVSSLKDKLTPRFIRDLSNFVITYDGPPNGFTYAVYDNFPEIASHKYAYKNYENAALVGDGHIDWAALAGGDSSDSMLPPGLKKEMARYGKDIIFDSTVGDDNSRTWTEEERATLVDYNFNDVLGTKEVGKNEILTGGLYARDIVRELYPYTSSRYTLNPGESKKKPLARDLTANSLAGNVLIGPKKIKPEDWPEIRYSFPVPKEKGSKETKIVDLWEYMKETEDFIPPYIDDFFKHFRGKSVQTFYEDRKAKSSQPITHTSTMNIPYYKDGKPIDAYIRISTGGAHGSVYAGLSEKNNAEVKQWIRAHVEPSAKQKPTIDKENVVHIDWSSFYPVMVSKMGICLTKDGFDRFTNIINRRLNETKPEIKQVRKRLSTEEFSEKEKDELLNHLDQLQKLEAGLKFILNNMTGGGNTKKSYALLPLDNKIFAMRLIGNMNIWCLGQRLVQQGAYIISTNTDGLYVCNISVDKAQEVIDGYVDDYGMPVDPEPMARFINRNTSERVEFDDDPYTITKVNGDLAHGNELHFQPGSIGRNITYPLVSCYAVLRYMEEDKDWLNKPYDRDKIKDRIVDVLENHPEAYQAWYHIFSGTSARKFVIDGKVGQHINRVLLTKEGSYLNSLSRSTISKKDRQQLIDHIVNSDYKTLNDIIKNEFNQEEHSQSSINIIGDLPIEDLELDFGTSKEDSEGNKIFMPLNYDFSLFNRKRINDIINNDERFKESDMKIEQALQEALTFIFDYIEGKLTKDKYEKAVEDDPRTPRGNSRKKKITNILSSDSINQLLEPAGDYKANHFIYRSLNSEEWSEVKIWKKGALTGYPSNRGVTVNTHEEVVNFDYQKHIDVEAYVEWSEQLLSNWKVTASIPQIGLENRDDTVNIKSKGSSKLKNKDRAKLELKKIYGMISEQEEELLKS